MWTENGYQTVIVYRGRPTLVLGVLFILAAPGLLAFLLVSVLFLSAPMGALGGIAIVVLSAVAGIWMVGAVTRIDFSQYAESISVTRGHVPLFLWFQRTKRVSREDAKTARVRPLARLDRIFYLVEVAIDSDGVLRLYDGDDPGQAEDMVRVIRRWSGVESVPGPEAKVL